MLSDARTAAYVSLLTGHQHRLYAYITAMVSDLDTARDILQEVNAVLWEKAGEFEEGTNFGAWAAKVAYFQTLAYLKRRKLDRHVFDAELLSDVADQAAALDTDTGTGPNSRATSGELDRDRSATAGSREDAQVRQVTSTHTCGLGDGDHGGVQRHVLTDIGRTFDLSVISTRKCVMVTGNGDRNTPIGDVLRTRGTLQQEVDVNWITAVRHTSQSSAMCANVGVFEGQGIHRERHTSRRTAMFGTRRFNWAGARPPRDRIRKSRDFVEKSLREPAT